MPKETYQQSGVVLKGRGMDGTLPISPLPTWFNVNGVVEDNAILQRIKGKKLLQRCNSHVIGIHSDQLNVCWIQTSIDLRMIPLPELHV